MYNGKSISELRLYAKKHSEQFINAVLSVVRFLKIKIMIIYKNIDSVWINTSDGVTVYFSYNLPAKKMSAYVNTPCGVPQITHFGKSESIEEGRLNLEKLNRNDADEVFKEIKKWRSNLNYDLDYFLQVSHKMPL